MNTNTEQKVKLALASVLQLKDDASIKRDAHLRKDLRLDSMSSIMFLMRLEENIKGFFVDPETLKNTDLETVDTVIKYIDTQLDSKNVSVH